VFSPAAAGWWDFRIGAAWRRPLGPESSIEGLERHPVVHVAYEDAKAYATWAGKDLPTEAEWEFAARGGLAGADYAWGDELAPGGAMLANYWQGAFPHENLELDGWYRTSPVGAFAPNGYGLHDMDAGLVRCAQGDPPPEEPLLRGPKSARRAEGRELRSGHAPDPHTSQGDERRLAPLRRELLSPIPSGGAAPATDRHLDLSPGVPMRHPHVGIDASSSCREPSATCGARPPADPAAPASPCPPGGLARLFNYAR
jgi:hypothetical protein